MMTNRPLPSVIALLLIAACVVCTGCTEEKPKPQPEVVVVDLDVIGKALGLQEEVIAQIRNDEQMLLSRRQEIIKNMQNQIKAKQDEFGEEPTEEQQQELQRMAAQAQNNLMQVNREIQNLAMQNRQQRIAQVREQIKPYVERVAKRRGAKIVLEASNHFWAADQVDISSEVIAEKLDEDGPKKPSTPASTKPADGAGTASDPADTSSSTPSE